MLTLREGLRQRGHDARLFTSSARPLGVRGLADYECLGTMTPFRIPLRAANPWAFVKFRRVLTEFQPDIVHIGMFLVQLSPLILPLLKEVPSLYHIHWYRPICLTGTKMLPDGNICRSRIGTVCYQSHCIPFAAWMLLMLQMKLFHRWRKVFNLIVTNSEAMRQRLVLEGIEPVETVWYGVPIRPPRPQLSLPSNVAFAGRFVREKGIDLLLTSFAKVVAQIPEAKLSLAGDGPERGSLNRLIDKLGLSSSVFMLGYLSHQEMERHFADAWVQAIPSRWNEPFGIVAIEAMMRGTAVVATRSGGLPEIVQDGQTGFLVEPGNVDALTEALLKILSDSTLAERMGARGREKALKKFTEDIYVDKFIQLYERISHKSFAHLTLSLSPSGERGG